MMCGDLIDSYDFLLLLFISISGTDFVIDSFVDSLIDWLINEIIHSLVLTINLIYIDLIQSRVILWLI